MRSPLQAPGIALGLLVIPAARTQNNPEIATRMTAEQSRSEGEKQPLVRSDEQWREQLSPEEFAIARRGETEAPFSGAYWSTTAAGTYLCRCCGQILYRSQTKFDAGCGWPSFWEAAEPNNIERIPDSSHGMRRIELRCSRCGAHLGHVFDDGPQPTGQRHCINSASLRFIPAGEH